jgi:hypothetical protein
MLEVVRDQASRPTALERVVFVLFDESSRGIFARKWAAMQQIRPPDERAGSAESSK